MTAKIEPWMKLAAEHIEDAYTVAIQQQVVGTEPAIVEVAYIIAAHAPKETGIKPDTAQAAIKQEPSVPDGWKLVPLSPTKEMIDAIHNGWKDAQPDGEYDGEKTTSMYAMHVAAYKAGVKAAPVYMKLIHRDQPAEAEHE